MTEEQMQDLTSFIFESFENEVTKIKAVETFEEAGLLTNNRGLVVSVENLSGKTSRFQITIVKDR